jgi:hypothetical protein
LIEFRLSKCRSPSIVEWKFSNRVVLSLRSLLWF